ncbi:hypothetical protein FGADI_13284 [Fusarium gaditjirri]|uniref:C6 transcription factor n=1 Tax=Fusarium gaditjirri TaxID=282569 RepID=A0A8H4SQ33_9HYPO|nr:hypothetical protein FGADI_13284 [Fusarium gaditjirri]
MVFRDQTRHTVQKALAHQRASRLPSTPQWSPDVSSRHSFLSLYVSTYSRGFGTPLQALLKDYDPNGHLQSCVDAVGLAFMAFQLNRQDLIPLASQHYLKAIQRLAMVLRSSMQGSSDAANQSLSDVTLQSVLLLDLYEKMSYQYQQLSEYPGLPLSHIQGALSIVQSRPRGDFSDPTMQQLAARTVFALALSCGAAGKTMPESLVRLYNDLDTYVRGPLWTLTGLFIRLIDFQVAARAAKLELREILKRAKDFRGELSAAQNNIPRSWQPRRIHTNEAFVFNGYYDVYPGHDLPQTFNGYRMLRLGVCGLLQKFVPSTEVAEEITQITREICASVPHITLPTVKPQNTLPFSPLQILQGSGLLSALYAAAQTTEDPLMRAWILHTLTWLADRGVKSAQTVAYIIKSLPEMNQWDVFSLVGNYASLA